MKLTEEQKVFCDMINEIKKLQEEMPNGQIFDADTVLFDFLNENSKDPFSGIATDVLHIWERSRDKQSVEQMFYELTGCKFNDFLSRSINMMYATLMAHAVKEWLREEVKSFRLDIPTLIKELHEVLSAYDWKTLKCKGDFWGSLIDSVEGILIDCDIYVYSADREEAIQNGEDPDDLAMLYGELYDEFADLFAEILNISR